MHTQNFFYTSDDLKYTDRDTPVKEMYFHYNSDLSGEVHISDGIHQMYVPGWMLLEFVGRFCNSEQISKLEQMSGRETLGLPERKE